MFRKVNLWFCSFALAIVVSLWLESCIEGVPAFAGGIRVTVAEALLETPDAQVPVESAFDAGTLTSTIGPGVGTATSFSGFTDLNGVDDHVNAQTNANWNISVNFFSSDAPNCPSATVNHSFPIGGGEEHFVCLVP